MHTSHSVPIGTKLIEANSKDELTNRLTELALSFPKKTEKLTTEQDEKYIMCLILKTLMEFDKIRYPMQLFHRDRPDFSLVSATCEIGYEVTVAINPNNARFKAKQLSSGGNLSRIRKWGAKLVPKEEDDYWISQGNSLSPAWKGNEVEAEYAQMVFEEVERKTDKLQREGFEKFSKNHLLIFSRQTLPMLDEKEAFDLCAEKLNREYWNKTDNLLFDRILVKAYNTLTVYSPCKDDKYETLIIDDLLASPR